MRNDNEFDLDAILAEFAADAQETPASVSAPAEPAVPAEPEIVLNPDIYPHPDFSLALEPEPAPELPELYAREELPPEPEKPRSRFSKAPRGSLHDAEPENPPPPKKEPRLPKPPREKKVRSVSPALGFLLGLIFTCLCLLVLAWVVLYLHPASGTLSFSGADTRLRLSEKLDSYANNAAADALGDMTYIRKIYTLEESDTVSPAPDPDGFGTTDDPAEIEELIKRASILLDGQTVTFNPNADFVPGEPIRYYLDDTILVIAWKEYINERCCTFAEVKVAHGSQLRRKLAEDSYGSSVQLYASDMANASNAVVAINGDFYAYRKLGITVYQRKLYRNSPETVDTCFFTASGDMLFTRAGELMGDGETQQFIDDNDVVFSVAFGPVLVDNGELQYCARYPIGEIDTMYSRSCIAMTDDLHYLLMTINWDGDRPRANINELARYVYSKGVQKAYALDGGQTSEIIMMGGPINHVDFGYERIVSDIIYFATAIPEEVRS
ncbi:MAG: phosphodiester glycosidase family protein [Oscillospiraceae bacterium]|nr:phosphodiester glycosidase family protein [Oscillospiraceae bacterium]